LEEAKIMKKQLWIVGTVLVMLTVGFCGCLGSEVTDYFNDEYEANENTVLKVTTLNGQIEINDWDGETISLNAIKRTRLGREELDKAEIIVTETDNLIEIEAKYTGEKSTTPSVDMNIKVPKYVTIDSATTSNGAIQISGTKGNTTAHSSNGAILLENVDGYVKATTSNGRIEITGTTGIRGAQSSNLGISAEVFDFQENITIGTSNGGITVYLNPSLNADIEMTTSNGHITISGLSLNLTISEEKHKEGKLGEGGYTLNIHTSNGNINLYKLEI
jgi:DUF4097 and DUF4098 domain-containing protein YvlB